MQPEPGSSPLEGVGVESGITARDRYEPPSYEVICLACEISAYAPDEDTPLF